MQNIILSGLLLEDSEVKTDKNGHELIRFRLACYDYDYAGKRQITIFKCIVRDPNYKNLKVDDMVFITGKLFITKLRDNIDLIVNVFNINRGDGTDIKKFN